MKRVRLCNVALSYAEEEINEDRKAAFIQYAMKRSLSTRFDLRGQSGCQRLKQQCDEIIAKGLCAYRRMKTYSAIKYAGYRILLRAPFMYSAFRFLNDPSLLCMETHKAEEKTCSGDI